MQIVQVELQNIKSYDGSSEPISFAPGVNLIVGPNGAGKSTILEAIGFVLFGALPYKQDEFKRKGHNGPHSITVRVRSLVDDREYEVVRYVTGQNYVYDPELRSKVREGVGDTAQWVQEHFRIDGEGDLRPVFDNAIGVQQGMMTAVFMSSERERQTVFDRLLQLEGYEKAWGNLKETGKYIEGLITGNGEARARLEGRLEDFEAVQTQAQEYRDKIQEAGAERAQNDERLEIVGASLAMLDFQSGQLESLSQSIEDYETKLEGLRKQLTGADAAVGDAEKARQTLDENEDAHHTYQEAQGRFEELEGKRKQRDKLREQRNTAQAKLKECDAHLQNIESDLAEVAEAEAELERLAPLVKRQENLEKERESARDDQKKRDGLLEQIERESADRERLAGEIETLVIKVARREEIAGQIESLEDKRQSIQDALERISEEGQALEDALDAAEDALREAESDFDERERLLKRIGQHQKRLRAEQDERSRVESEAEQRNALDDQITACRNAVQKAQIQKAEAKSTFQRTERQLEELSGMRDLLGADDAVCPVCQQRVTPESHQQAQAHYAEEEARLRREREAASETLSQAESAIHEQEALQAGYESELESLADRSALAQIERQIAEIEADIQECEESLKDLEGAEETYTRCEAEHKRTDDALDDLRKRESDLRADYRELSSQITGFQKEMADLPSKGQLEDKEADLERTRTSIKEAERSLETRSGVDARLEDIQRQLDELDDPRATQNVARSKVEKKADLEQGRAGWQGQHEDAQGKFDAADEALEVFSDLDNELADTRQKLEQTRDEHDAYIASKQTAETLEDRRRTRDEIQANIRQAEGQRVKAASEYEALQNEYDSEEHDRVRQEKKALDKRQVELDVQIESNRGELKKREVQIEQLEAEARELKRLERESERLKERQEAFKFIRKGIRDAGPRVRRRKVDAISAMAKDVFRHIMEDNRLMLHWDEEDYGISVESGGERRPFNLLSGGEQMAAALSIRLALLKQIGIRFMFLDEPTANLDEERRIHLANHLSGIKGLEQLFVISHDDTFASHSNHVIQVSKENGVSKAEVY